MDILRVLQMLGRVVIHMLFSREQVLARDFKTQSMRSKCAWGRGLRGLVT